MAVLKIYGIGAACIGGGMEKDMKKTILFTELVSDASLEAAVQFSRQGDLVYALVAPGERKVSGIICLDMKQNTPKAIRKAVEDIAEKKLDILVLSSAAHCTDDGDITCTHDFDGILKVLDENVNRNLTALEVCLPLLRRGTIKRIAVITEKKSSINLCEETTDFAYNMSLASVNMMEKILFNALRPEGFSFRNYAASEKIGGMKAAEYIQKNLCYNESDDYIHSEENRLVMRDAFLCELPW